MPAYYGYYETCAVFQRGACLVRGLAGTFTRLSTELSWRRNYVDSDGAGLDALRLCAGGRLLEQRSTPTASRIRKSRTSSAATTTSSAGSCRRSGSNTAIPSSPSTTGACTSSSRSAQIVARPNETRIGRLPNEDAQSLVFDDTTLFNWDKFSGYDRVEGGVRGNIGGQYSFTG